MLLMKMISGMLVKDKLLTTSWLKIINDSDTLVKDIY